MDPKNQNLQDIVDKMVQESLKKHFEKYLHTDIKNENGNASIKHSGNGIVYVDNTGIAYAFMLFYQYFMKDQLGEKDFNDLLDKLDKIINDNRNAFVDVMKDFKE
ncbi:hypothetical protein [Niallia sp. 01092]|uniref:hypothetical protein n=1 Tax=unclassified Niallia TaxID=2837522 RepID=UPI003FD0FBF5